MTLIVKLGSSIVAADDGELRTEVLDSVCQQVNHLRQNGEQVAMVTSGAIARGMRLLARPMRPQAMDELQATSAVGQGDLFRAYESRLTPEGTRAAQVLLTAADLAAHTNYVNARQTLRRLIKWGVVPIINENDTTATDEITFGDNDFLAAQVAILLKADLLVLLTNTDGLYTSDPRYKGARLIEEVEDFTELFPYEISNRTSVFGSGGMGSKVAAAEMASRSGVPTVICNGVKAGSLDAAVAGRRVGTRFAPQPGKASGFKLWLKYAKPTAGKLIIDSGAARALTRQGGSSLLPVGIVSVEGEFVAGDAVEVATTSAVVGKGMVSYSSRELNQVIGRRSAEVRSLFPHKNDAVIPPSRFVLL